MAKERRAIIVEGQIDALRLIENGFDFTVAGQGTAFGEEHAQNLRHLGVNQVFLALDADDAGQEAARKIGHFFQKEGAEVKVIRFPPKNDPDSFLSAKGAEGFLKLMENSIGYLEFLVQHEGKKINDSNPAGKNELVQLLAKQIRKWNHPLMVHESCAKWRICCKCPSRWWERGKILFRICIFGRRQALDCKLWIPIEYWRGIF